MSTRNFVYITIADLIVRSAYQMGKTPLLPIFASMLGASNLFLGLIVSVSTMTGMLLKPGIGFLSDRWGRRWWLLIGTAFFAFVPFFYHFVETPGELFAIRIIHGTATAIYGPVTIAYVAELSNKQRAERIGWFGTAKNVGYIIGPAVGSWLLLWLNPASVFTIIGLLSCLAFAPIALLSNAGQEEQAVTKKARQQPILRQLVAALKIGATPSSIWITGFLEATVYIALYAARTFLPLYELSLGMSVVLVGLFFSVQEGAHILLRPFTGRVGDKIGHINAICSGMLLMGIALPMLVVPGFVGINGVGLLALAVVIGAAQALIFPSTVALVSSQVDNAYLGTGLGIVGALRNAGKVAGPLLAGMLIGTVDYGGTFGLLGAYLCLGALLIWILARRVPIRASLGVYVYLLGQTCTYTARKRDGI